MFFVSRGNMEACSPGIQGVVPADRCRVLYNGIDLRRFTRKSEIGDRFRAEHSLGGGLLVGVACALRPGKQLDHLFDAIAGMDNKSCTVVVAGGQVSGFEDYAQRLLSYGRQVLGSRFVHLGHIEDIRGFYNALDLVVNTSEGEACSISILEALACGCPIVGYSSISVAEQVLPGGGEIVPQNDVSALAAALSRWCMDRELIESARSRARARVDSEFNIEVIASALWDQYKAVLSANGG
jgi:glycosyltransferase involved in cell wall biosynthesis